MMTLTQISAHTWHLTHAEMLLEVDADDESDAMSYTANRFPGTPCELNVQDYAAALEDLHAEMFRIAA
ncbi:MAG TPA: hypothetical protein PKK10_11600 [Woeseiaceae bacterium]|nr:hypothetical protein [Woeseiaceae bacterium]